MKAISWQEKFLWVVSPWTLSTLGDWVFSVIAPTLWNLLPVNIRHCSSLQSFKDLLKTYLYNQKISFNYLHCTLCFVFMSAPWNNTTRLIINALLLLFIMTCLQSEKKKENKSFYWMFWSEHMFKAKGAIFPDTRRKRHLSYARTWGTHILTSTTGTPHHINSLRYRIGHDALHYLTNAEPNLNINKYQEG